MKKITLTIFACLATFPFAVNAQWTTSGSNIYNSNSGNVGIGTTSPALKLHVAGGSSNGILLEDITLSRSTYMTQENGFFTINAAGGNGIKFISDGSSNTLVVKSGNVGIGVTSPVAPLNIKSNNTATSDLLFSYNASGDYRNSIGNNFADANPAGNLMSLLVSNGTSTGQTNVMSLRGDGNVGIGTTAPGTKLEVSGSTRFSYFPQPDTYWLDIRPTYTGTGGDVRYDFVTNYGVTPLTIGGTSGKVGIGTTSPDEMLTVNGTTHSKEVIVDLSIYPDYVFKPTYHLPTLAEVKTYIDQNHHLPDMPTEAEVIKNGLKVGESESRLTRKVEELTLYLLEKDNQLQTQNTAMQEQQSAMQSLQSQFDQMKQQLKSLINKKTASKKR